MKYALLFLMLLLSGMAGAQIVNIPDAAFKSKLLQAAPNNNVAMDNGNNYVAIDTNNDGEIQVAEAQVIRKLNVYIINSTIQSMQGIAAFTNLKELNCSSASQLTSLDCTALSHLKVLNCAGCYNLDVLNIQGLTNLVNLNCSWCDDLTDLNLQGLTALKVLNCDSCNNLTVLDVENSINLTELTCVNCDNLEEIHVQGLINLETLDCSGCSNLMVLNVQGLIHLQSLNCGNCSNLTGLNAQGIITLKSINCNSCAALTELNVEGLVDLEILNCVNCSSLTHLDLAGLNALVTLNCRSCTSLSELNIPNLTLLKSLTVKSCTNLGQLNLQGLTSLEVLDCFDCNFTTLNLAGLQNLKNLTIGNLGLSVVDFTPVTNIEILDIKTYNLTSLDLTALENLKKLYVNDYDYGGLPLPFQTLVLGQKPVLNTLYIDRSQIESLDLSGCTALIRLEFYQAATVPSLFINLKNGTTQCQSGSHLHTSDATTTFVCLDEGEEAAFLNFVVNTSGEVITGNYCTFTPGGAFNKITGHFTFDSENDGCDSSDTFASFAKVVINDGTHSGTSFSSTEGNYNFYTQSGTFTLVPEPENDWFIITPPSATIALPTVNNSTTTQNFCIAPSGIHPDVEVVITPLSGAAPGFDADYKIVYRNKGNQTLSGTVTLNYDDSVLDYVSAFPAGTSSTSGSLNWDYTNLLPFESRTIVGNLNLNGPMETPAVNIDDVLVFSASITPTTGDETPADNTFTLNQIVTGSFDPNDITCLEGEIVSPDKIGEYLHYNINFENTGTAPATFIVVKNMIDQTKFDISSLQLMDASHAIETRINGNKVEFIFDNINLGPEEKGNVTFKIKTKNTLQVNEDVTQQADIFFDYNWPIQTNEATTTFEVLSRGDFAMDDSVKVYPNPAKGIVTVSAGSNVKSIQLYDIQGRLLQSGTANDVHTTIDLSSRASGMYFVKVLTDEGIKVEKVAKE